jgi:hypothetical protein
MSCDLLSLRLKFSIFTHFLAYDKFEPHFFFLFSTAVIRLKIIVDFFYSICNDLMIRRMCHADFFPRCAAHFSVQL